MVVFSCDACGDSLRKKDVQKHYQFACRRCESLTCVDCKKQFWGDDYIAHTQCISDESFKYGLVSQHKDDKGQMKQNQWRSNIDALLSDRTIDKRWIPILLEMQKYENVPRKKKPFMNWCKCTMRKFPFKVVEEIFDKLVEVNSLKHQNENQGNSEASNANPGIKAHGNGELGVPTKTKNAKRKLVQSNDSNDEPAEPMETDGSPGHEKKKRRSMAADSCSETSVVNKQSEEDATNLNKEAKFKLKKCVVGILLAKGEALKVKRIYKKVLSEYAGFIERTGGVGAKVWSEVELSAKLEKLVSSSKVFKNVNGVVDLSNAGKAKYMAKSGVDEDTD